MMFVIFMLFYIMAGVLAIVQYPLLWFFAFSWGREKRNLAATVLLVAPLCSLLSSLTFIEGDPIGIVAPAILAYFDAPEHSTDFPHVKPYDHLLPLLIQMANFAWGYRAGRADPRVLPALPAGQRVKPLYWAMGLMMGFSVLWPLFLYGSTRFANF